MIEKHLAKRQSLDYTRKVAYTTILNMQEALWGK